MAASRFNTLQIASRLMRHCGGKKKREGATKIPGAKRGLSWEFTGFSGDLVGISKDSM
jgi:hypothetical protein